MSKFSDFRICALFIIFLLSLNVGCGTKRSSDIGYVMPPKWVRGYSTDEIFSAVGLTSVNEQQPLAEIISRAEGNAIENLRADILIKFENCFIATCIDLFNSNRAEIVKKLNIIADNAFSNNVLRYISRRDEFWISPDSNVAYLMVSGDSGKIVRTFIDALNKDKNVFINRESNPETASIINGVKNDILNGNCFYKKNDIDKIFIENTNNKTTNVVETKSV